jgi:PIN domain nuclease of toxin-antitoxin system
MQHLLEQLRCGDSLVREQRESRNKLHVLPSVLSALEARIKMSQNKLNLSDVTFQSLLRAADCFVVKTVPDEILIQTLRLVPESLKQDPAKIRGVLLPHVVLDPNWII